MISEANQKMLSLLGDVLHDRQPSAIDNTKWSEILREMRAQTVYALPAAYIDALGLSEQDYSYYRNSILVNRAKFYKVMKAQTAVQAMLDDAGIPSVVIKGAAAAINYPHPEDRCMGDVDIIVMPQDFLRAYELLLSSGYTALQTPDNFHRHIEFHNDNSVEIELHEHFSSSDNSDQNDILDSLLCSAIPQRVMTKICDEPVAILPVIENGLVLLGHINQHFSSGLGLRQIIDWMLYVEQYLDDETWNNTFANLADQIGMKRLAMVTTAMCLKYLGMDKDIHWCPYEPICDTFMEYILRHGNFNRRLDRASNNTISVLRVFRHPIRGFAFAQKAGLLTWEACNRHKYLKPFAWIYQLGRWTVRGIKHGIGIKETRVLSGFAKDEAQLIEGLELTKK